MKPPFVIELLADHDRENFACGTEPLDRYFTSQVTQDVRRHLTNCFVAVEVEMGIIAGYYAIAAASIPTPDLPEVVTKKLPRYPSLPAIRVGRLAIDLRFQGKGLGGALLADAAARGLRPRRLQCSLTRRTTLPARSMSIMGFSGWPANREACFWR